MARTRAEAHPSIGDGGTCKPGFATAALAGAVGGLYGAAAMSVLRLALRCTGPASSTRWSRKPSRSGFPIG
jgi:hypothetical protein